MKVLFALLLSFTNWYYIPSNSSVPVEVEKIDLNLKTNELAVTFLSLSNGESILIQHSNGENILINTGGSGTEEELRKLFELYNVNKISTVILTNVAANSENLSWVLQNYDVKQMIAGGSTIKHFETFLNKDEDVSYHIWSSGTKQQILPGLNTEVLFEGNGENEGMDLSIQFLRHRLLIMTSSSDRAMTKLLTQQLADVNIVKIADFARENVITDELIKHIDPQIAIVFHSKIVKPSSDLFKSLQAAWIDVYYTKKHGTVTMKFTDVNYEVITISNNGELN
ncbi:ATP-dependent DNA helicase [Bacillus sp. 31A1R]|uniref:ATP-dependent DNA helicase n=1 Tax=Robertmurraya mangrovi TaxID=3098077 RepID=A0ABU5J1F3_9BACI|nr:ATP-dependent DNA helicase [Bacillus sp. 31A1R]MDZ5473228.1 ATP-dependent DNA helicase [Bacillus sp. 31A1R]